jgi:zinc transporter ZupT
MPGSAVVYALATFVSTLLGGLFALRFAQYMDRIMAFSGGVLLAAGLLDLLPEGVNLAVEHNGGRAASLHGSIYEVFLCAAGGFLLFYLAERMAILRSYHSHHHHPPIQPDTRDQSQPSPVAAAILELEDTNHSHPGSASAADERSARQEESPRRRQVGILGAAGLCIHSLLDGFSIGIAFHASSALGLLVAIAVIGHDFSDGITTVVLLVSSRNSRGASIFWLVLDALAPLIGVGLASILTLSPHHLADLLGFFAGMFLYLGATHMLPEAHAISDSSGIVVWMVIGVVLMFLVTHLVA